MENNSTRIVKKCPKCKWRLFDKITPASGRIEIKCPKCSAIVVIDLSYRRYIRSSCAWQDSFPSAPLPF